MREQGLGSAQSRPGFEESTAHLRTELLAHCYRMTGSSADAEDAVQETYVKAWQAYDSFEGRASVRSWMYRIATNTCLSDLGSARRRVLPRGLSNSPGDPTAPLNSADEPWLEPLPEAWLWQSAAATPEEQLLARENITLAWAAALQNLPPNQRAVLLLREVLGFSAAETAETLGTSEAAVNSALQRSRSGLAALDTETVPAEVETQAVARFVKAFEAHDFDAVVASVSAQVTWQMPPFDRWYQGAHQVATLSFTHCPAQVAGDLKFRIARANGQPAVGMYLRKGRAWEAFQFQVLRVNTEGLIDDVVGWFEPQHFRLAGLPLVLE